MGPWQSPAYWSVLKCYLLVCGKILPTDLWYSLLVGLWQGPHMGLWYDPAHGSVVRSYLQVYSNVLVMDLC